MKKLLRTNKGVTLIELVVSMALLAVISVPLISIFGGSAILVKNARDSMQLTSISKQIQSQVYFAFKNGTETALRKLTIDSNGVISGVTKGTANDNQKDFSYGIKISENKAEDPDNIVSADYYDNYKYSIEKVGNGTEIFVVPTQFPSEKYMSDEVQLKISISRRRPDNQFVIVESFFLMIPQ